MPTLAASASITDEQVARFERDGFLALERLVEPDELAHIAATLARLHAACAGRERGNQFDLAGPDEDGKPASLPQLLNPSASAPELLATRTRGTCHALARRLLGGDGADLDLSCEHAILKPARHGAATPWHQDEAYWRMPGHDARGVAIWMALQPATIDNGCLWYVPGSHRGAIRPHRPIGGDPRVQGLEALGVDASAAMPVPLPAGGAVVHHIRTLHYAGPNRTAASRSAYTLAFHRPSVARDVPHDMSWIAEHRPPREERARGV